MRVGVVCEGPTDFITMVSFLSPILTARGLSVKFDLIQPALDNTLPGGWTQVFYWLEQNPPANRNAVFRKGQSLFSNDDDDKKYDALIFQIDTDIIGEPSFESFITKRSIVCIRPTSSVDRGTFVQDIINKIAGHSSLAISLTANEVPIALVESCETWVVAAASSDMKSETLTSEELVNSFGAVVAALSKQPILTTYASINKTTKTRHRVCAILSKTASPAKKAPHFDKAVDNLCSALVP